MPVRREAENPRRVGREKKSEIGIDESLIGQQTCGSELQRLYQNCIWDGPSALFTFYDPFLGRCPRLLWNSPSALRPYRHAVAIRPERRRRVLY
jgi:hypothetical protein